MTNYLLRIRILFCRIMEDEVIQKRLGVYDIIRDVRDLVDNKFYTFVLET